ncbi:MAG TPA: M23 family metallopeptidase [Kineosporiaceae bacterium]
MTVFAALVRVVAVPLATGMGVAVGVTVADPVTRPTAAVDSPRPVAVVPGPLVVSFPPLPPPPGSTPPTPRASPSPSRPADAPGVPGPPGSLGRYAWPLAPRPAVVRPFRLGPFRWSAGHRGVDLAARPGQPVLAAAAGRVSYAGPLADRSVVVVVHADGVRTTYEPVDPAVRVGSVVAIGALLGVVAGSGSHCQPGCLHWGALRGAEYVDPLTLLPARGPIVLLPLGEVPDG